MSEVQPRETVVLATDFAALVSWYTQVLGFRVTKQFGEGFHYCNRESVLGGRQAVPIAKRFKASISRIEISEGERLSRTEFPDPRDRDVNLRRGRRLNGSQGSAHLPPRLDSRGDLHE